MTRSHPPSRGVAGRGIRRAIIFGGLATALACLTVRGQAPVVPDKTGSIRDPKAPEVLVPPGYAIEAFATGLNYPVDITFGDKGEVYVAEAGHHTYGTQDPRVTPPAEIVQLLPSGQIKVIYDKTVSIKEIRKHASSKDMPEGIIPPITGVTYHKGKLYVSHRSRYSVLDPQTGEFKTIVNGLPCWGEFLNAKPIFDRDGKMVFFVSTQGNSGVLEKHWTKVIDHFNKPDAHEVPGEDVTLTGINFSVPLKEPTEEGGTLHYKTGPYLPLGKQAESGMTIPGQKICNGAFYRCDPDGSNLERIAWGFRSCFGYRFAPDGRLITTQNSANPMPPRGLWWDYESIYEVVKGEWYGWPDYYSGIPITDARFAVKKGEGEFVLTEETHRKLLKGQDRPRQPLVRLSPHAAAQGMVFGRREFGFDPDHHILVAEFGAIVPAFKGERGEAGTGASEDGPPGPVPPGVDLNWPGFRVQAVDLRTGQTSDFVLNRSGRPATAAEPDKPWTGRGGGLERPIALEWGPDGSLFIVDFGVISFTKKGMNAFGRTGVIWRVTRPGLPGQR